MLLALLLIPTVTVFLVAAVGLGLSGQLLVASPSRITGAILNLTYIILKTGIALSAAILVIFL